MRAAFVILAVICLAGCGDPQQHALNDLAQRGYTLSVAEFHRAAEKGDVEALESFLQAGTNVDVPDKRGETALAQALRARQNDAAHFLLAHGAALSTGDAQNDSLLSLAVRSGDAALVRLVAPAHSEAQRSAALLECAQLGHREAFRALLPANQAAMDAALLAAAEKGRLEMIDACLQAGADPEARQASSGLKPLHLAASHDDAAAVQLLLRNGASLTALSQDARSVWQLAADSDGMKRLLASPMPPLEKRPRLQDATIQGGLVLLQTRLTELPLTFTGIDGRAAVIRLQGKDLALHVRPAEVISDTPYRLHAIVTESRNTPAWALPQAIITHTETGEHHLLMIKAPAYAEPLCAILQVNGTDTEYEAQTGDSFTLSGQARRIAKIERSRVSLQAEDSAGLSFILRP